MNAEPDIFSIQKRLEASFRDSLDAWGVEPAAILLENPKDPSHGDLSTPLALSLAKQLKKPPLVLAQSILDRFKPEPSLVSKVETAAPGFINLRLNPEVYDTILESALQKGERYGENGQLSGLSLLLEFVSANPTGPLNVVNARAAVLGDSIARLIRASGGTVATEYYVNDAGNQARLFGESLEAAISRVRGVPREAPEGGYQGAYMEDLARQYLAEEGPAAEANLATGKLGEWGMDRVVQWHRESLDRYGVHFDRWFSERRNLHDTGLVARTLESLRQAGLTYEKDGATWIRTSDYGAHKDEVLVKSNGLPAYIVADIAYHLDKWGRGHGKIVNIMGPDHHGHILSMKAAHRALGFPPESFQVLVAQQVSLLSGGEKVKMSKREGKFVTMDELLEQVGRDAARFFFVMRGANTHLDFDIEVARKQTEENPVFYIQYAHARIESLLRKCRERGLEPFRSAEDFRPLREPEALLLLKEIMEYPKWVVDSAQSSEPHRMVVFLQTLAADFHFFYSKHRILDAPEGVARARLGLALGVQTILKNALGLLGVSAPGQM
jgi:arginyl-tRNA synthetase